MPFAKGPTVLPTAFCILSGILAELSTTSIRSNECPGLQVLVHPATVKNRDRVTLTCSATCSLSNNPTYIWYRNSQPVTGKHTATDNTLTIRSITNEDTGFYACAVRDEGPPSPAVCVWKCYGVAYNPESMCALEGSSVELHSYYSYPPGLTVQETFWFIKGTNTDLKANLHYKGRVTYIGNTSNHTLSIRGLNLSDSKDYAFRFITKEEGGWSGVYVPLRVTGLQVLVDPATVNEGDRVTLTCSTTCSLSNNPTYIWYRNSQPVTNQHTGDYRLHIYPASPEDAGKYSCAVEGHESLISPESPLNVTYAPRHTTVSVSPPGDIKEGDSVTLTCSSDANPPIHTYTWYKRSGDQSSVVGSVQNYTFANINSGLDGHYYCVAQNGIGQDTSPEVEINVEYAPRHTTVSISPFGDIKEGDSVTLTCSSDANPPVLTYTWHKRNPYPNWVGQGQNVNITAEHNIQYFCTAENKHGSSVSNDTSLDVHYHPKNTTASVHPSDEVVEGESVSLTCHSDANPPVQNYTWYLNRQGAMSAQLGEGQSYNISNVRAEHSGHYYCTAENKHGASNSSAMLLNVLYSPRNISVSPLSDLKDSVTLTCRSDANPAAHGYTWYRETDDGTVVQGTGMSLSLAAGLSGLYHCEAQNQVGSRNSTAVWVFLAVVFENDCAWHITVMYPVFGAILVIFLFLLVILCCRYLKYRRLQTSSTEVSQSNAQGNSNPVYANIPTTKPMVSATEKKGMAHTKDNGDANDGIQYTSIRFKTNKTHRPPTRSPILEGGVQYASVQFRRSEPQPATSEHSLKETQHSTAMQQGLSAVTQAEGECDIYSKVNKNPKP